MCFSFQTRCCKIRTRWIMRIIFYSRDAPYFVFFYFVIIWKKGGGKGCAHFYMNLSDLTQNLVKKLTLGALQMTYVLCGPTTVVCRIDLFFDSKFWFSLHIFLSTFCMIVILLRLCRAMSGGPFRYLEHLHTTAKNFSSVTLKKVFGEKVIFSKIFIRIF